MSKKIHERKCAGCFNSFNREELIKITKNHINDEIIINPTPDIFGRSVYVCPNETCINNLLKKDKINKHLKKNLTEKDKEKIKNVLYGIIVLKL